MKRLGLLILVVLGVAECRGDEIYQDFRGKNVDERLFRFHGPEAALRVKPEPQGLRVTLPAEPKGTSVGLVSRFQVKGDFEITVGYEILQAETPAKGSGVGVEVYLNTDTPTEDAIVFYRIARPKDGQIYMCDRKTTNAGKRETTRRTFPTQSKSGHLRIARKDAEVVFSAAEGDSKDFAELCRYDWGAMDLKGIAMRAWGSQNPVDIRITEARIRDQSEPPPAPAETDATMPRPWWRLGLLAGLCSGLLLLAGLAWAWRRRLAARTETGNLSGSLSFYCSACGKHLKISAASAGKTVKCPACGYLAAVPNFASGSHAADPS